MLLETALVLLAHCLPSATSLAMPEGPTVPIWAELLDAKPSRAVVKDADLRRRITETGLAWRVRDRTTGVELLLVPPGTYERGASRGDDLAGMEEKPRHTVTITAPFYLGRYEVQKHEWDHLVDGAELSNRPGLPKEGLGFDDVVAYLRRANQADDTESSPLRLPTEAEWEYACRAGTDGPVYGKSLSSVAWYRDNAGDRARVVGTRKANALGFHDMLGNVKEWCSDHYDPAEYERIAAAPDLGVDPAGSSNPSNGHVLRGGAYSRPMSEARASARQRRYSDPVIRPYGLRVARHP
ncbi:formylglycine-generating enzyme family protein [Engelhardtia mirabilis]|uniref:Serine/threonine-protein kinase pkn1 n=1 Tax=Engelhardtia mirabilis TaxID=2528011 RepID=A0A518BP28_9BACT|nr:Serine/threonine-protein kinase pkn1 [Planctomycetes bacterium Pla133]QDV03033.1 Serine/threonine-protein kinase pkn1 [Planctomycetes bacterium Pla86]